MKRALFIDRDGTLVVEPSEDKQLDSLDKLEFVSGVFRGMYRLRQLPDFELVMVSNQDGLGTASFPEEDFHPPHNKMLRAFENEGISFDAIHIDPSLPEEHSVMRKPRTGMLTSYLDGSYDLQGSWVIGDRLTDLELARNLGCGGILLGPDDIMDDVKEAGLEGSLALLTESWDEIATFVSSRQRFALVERQTSETKVRVALSLDGEGHYLVDSGLKFFDHMLEQLGRHGDFDLELKVQGDLEVDEHHTIEDTALALGEAFDKALGDKRGIGRYAFTLPMDDAQARVVLDLGGRPWFRWDAEFRRERVGDMPTEMFMHFFKSFSDQARCNLHMEVDGENEHHKIEALFKAFARALKAAVKQDGQMKLPTTKGSL